jgi:hypothetical protein
VARSTAASIGILALAAALACASDGPKGAEAASSGQATPAPQLQVAPDTSVDELVAPIALYPDPLLAIVLPASTYPLDVVQAERFLGRLAKDQTLQPDPAWHESVRNLLNTPDVVRMMAGNLEWTIALGEQVAADSGEVMDAIQRFRRQADGAGNLVSDDKQTVTSENEIIAIQSTDPKIVYVPQYDPEVVVLPAPAPPVSYYPSPYPWYYYPWGAGAAWAGGVFFGATTAWAMGWAHNEIWHDVDWGDVGDIDFDRNVDIDRGDINVDNSVKNKFEGGKGQGGQGQRPGGGQDGRPARPGGGEGAGGGRPSQLPSQRPGGGNAWKPGSGAGAANRPSQLPSTRPSARPGDPGYRPGSSRPSAGAGSGAAGAGRPSTLPSRGGSGTRPSTGLGGSASTRPSGGAGTRPSTRPSGGSDRPSAGLGASTRPSTRPSGGYSGSRPSTRPSGGGSGARSGSYGGYGSSRDMGSASSRGKSSRSGSYSRGGGSGSYSRGGGSGSYSRGGGGGGYSRGGGGYSRGGGGGGRGGGGRGGGGGRR